MGGRGFRGPPPLNMSTPIGNGGREGLPDAGPAGASPAVRATDLRCEYLVDPLGLDVARPRLGWKLAARDPAARGLRQTSYRVLVATSPARLAHDEGDLWDTGRVESEQSTHVSFGGKALESRAACHWKVRVWTEEDAPSAWSVPARWTMGLLAPDDWTARWIGAARRASAFEGAAWIWSPEGMAIGQSPPGPCFFRRVVDLPAGCPVARAELRITADSAFGVVVNGVELARHDDWTQPLVVRLRDVLHAGSNTLAVGVRGQGDAPYGGGLLARLEVEFADGEELVVVTDDAWQAGRQRTAGWDGGAAFDGTGWGAARVLGPYGIRPWGTIVPEPMRPAPWLRRAFEVREGWSRAMAYVASLGYHELYLNGQRVSEQVLSPAVSDLSQRVRYVTYDLGALLRPGRNTAALWLGGGWSHLPVFGHTDGPLVRAQIEVEHPAGAGMRLVTDATWRVHPSHRTLVGAWRFGDFGGERVDAREEVADWNQADFDDAAWEAASTHELEVEVSAEKLEPDLRHETWAAVAVAERGPGAYRLDMGRNFTGWLELALVGEPGATAHIAVSEREDRECHENQRSEYVFGPRGRGVFRNRFNYSCGRWVTVRGVTAPPDPAACRATLVRSAFRRTGRFTCSSELLNRIYDTVLWTYESLCLGGFVVDCSHRERRGYGGDAHATMETALANYDQGAFHTKWLEDWRDVQGPDGNIPHTAPTYRGGGGPAWSGVCIALPWEVYLAYGDTRVLADNYRMMQRWLAFLGTMSEDGLLRRFGHASWGFLGDWVPPGRGQGENERVDERTTLFFNNCYRYASVKRMAEIARVLGKPDDAARYRDEAEELRRAVHAAFFDPETATYGNGEQPYLALALLTDLVPPEQRAAVVARLEHAIVGEKSGHVDSGIHGTYFLLKYLTEAGRGDLVHRMVSQTDYPSFGHMLAEGATTIWEQWDGLHSQCHSSFLSIGAWFLRGLAGLRPDPAHPGFARFHVRPGVVGELTFVRASYDSIHGPITVSWRLGGGRLTLDLAVPPNTTALVHLPADDPAAVLEGPGPAADAAGVRFLHHAAGEATFEVLSGVYSFRAPPRG